MVEKECVSREIHTSHACQSGVAPSWRDSLDPEAWRCVTWTERTPGLCPSSLCVICILVCAQSSQLSQKTALHSSGSSGRGERAQSCVVPATTHLLLAVWPGADRLTSLIFEFSKGGIGICSSCLTQLWGKKLLCDDSKRLIAGWASEEFLGSWGRSKSLT